MLLDQNGNPVGGNGGRMSINITPDDIKHIVCSCGSTLFSPAMRLGRVKGILFGEADDKIIPLDQTLCCTACGRPVPADEKETDSDVVEVEKTIEEQPDLVILE